jgi:hypothetical protein
MTGGGKEFLVGQNTQLKSSVTTLQDKLAEVQAAAEKQRAELTRAMREIEVLATALELRAEELQIKGDVRAGLLYEVARWRDEAKRCAGELLVKSERLAAADFERREAALKIEKAEGDAAALRELLKSTRQSWEEAHGKVESHQRVSHA